MAISGDLKAFGTFSTYHPKHPLRPALSSSKLGRFLNAGSNDLRITPKWPYIMTPTSNTVHNSHRCFVFGGNKLSSTTITQDAEGILLDAINMNFFDRLSLAWRILFPTRTARINSNARIAKQRLKMILFSDRCAVSDEARKKIVRNIIEALSEFVEIDSQDKVQLNVSTDADLGTVYSVTVPVRRVKPEYQDSEEDYQGKITGIEHKDTGETSGTVDVTFDFFIPSGK
ncbi:cell division topological specificity factor homolog, chloroplastic-like isoform X2 [Phoenix dactylifera]|uniref:Cell division topological specificity factor homolog, chloroplastic-like isoform X2 n=1 Tax=Phoenix dactylifera TaxID=42345 RepID=A0A8B7C241_PHODC|nr:cell division topological specificity factor homolog, chloroplastic-like isoform X2 [Phoenix dactylifera]